MWTPDGYLYLVVGNDEIGRNVKILLDPQSPENVISTRCLSRFPGYTYSASNGVAIGTSITGREDYLSIAEVDIRWRGSNNKARRFTGPYFKQTRIESSTCHVVDSDEFDLIIGQPTINELGLFRRNNPIIAAFRGVNTSMNSMPQALTHLVLTNSWCVDENADDEEQAAEERRRKAKDDKKRREKEEKDKKANK
ncbi:hypothetical protein J4E89_000148 [Alternaria sp. Ai002NY15]|nr:hypothetical protein J4E89_000148 [Alternaria sp. Ai002NY15]